MNFTQRECAELAQALTSVNYASDEEKEALKVALSTTKFETPYGKTVKKYLRHGIAIHHGGMLPKYRFLAEKLAQQGLLKVIVGTDTLGVGINMPLRTVVFTKLCKFDGRKVRLLTVRDFKQIAGRAGRRGFDTEGLVIAQAPEHVIENEIAQQKAAGNAKKLKKLRLKGPPDRGYVHWDDETFVRLHTSDSEALASRFDIDHSTLLYLLQRPEGAEHGYRDLVRLIALSHEEPARKSQLRRTARTLFQGLRHAGIVDAAPRGGGAKGQTIVLSGELQHDFSVHHALSLFLVEVLSDLDPELESFPLTVLSFVEAILEDPGVVLRRQQDKARDREYARLKAEGAEYDELREKLDKVSWPKPDAAIIEKTFEVFADHHPWVRRFEPHPKSVAREMFERWATFNEYVNEYGLERSEGVLLRYLTQAYKAMRQNIPELLKTDRIHEVIAYLREIITRADSSLVREWEAMRDGTLVAEADEKPPALDDDMPAFRARVHAELMQMIHAMAQKDWNEAAALLRRGEVVWGPMDLEDALEPFFASYDALLFNHAARARSLFKLDRINFGVYRVRQTLLDPEEDNMWFLEGKVDLADVRAEGGAAVRARGDRRPIKHP